jgi:glycosyltransferase involved in cell wall biosynthesis
MLNTKKKIVLVANYLPDKQESMKLFMLVFYNSYRLRNISVEIWHPTVFFGNLTKTTSSGIGKWLSYIDKYLLFPMVIIGKRIKSSIKKQDAVYHICDHSNAPYLLFLPRKRTVVTCHDVLAIRGAYGFKDAYCEASSTGKILQEWILYSLLKAPKIAFVSEFTKNQFLELKLLKNNKNTGFSPSYEIIYNGFNASFESLEEVEISRQFLKYNVNLLKPYIFHVGSSLPRKNRGLLIEMLHLLEDSWDGVVCFAGQKIDSQLEGLINKYALQDRVVSIVKPSHEVLVALYNGCEAFVFPSFSEGFGWPLIEAQACGAPVIASALNPMIEVCGGAALHADPNNPEEFLKAFKLLKDSSVRNNLNRQGLKNCERFNKEDKVNAYLEFYEY